MLNYIKKSALALITLSCLALALPASAQKTGKPYYPKGFRVGFGISGGIPTNSIYNGSAGVDVRLQYDLSRQTSFTLTSGYTHLFKEQKDLGIIPVRAGVKQFLNKNIYAMGELGAGFGTRTAMGNTLIWSPTVGFANRYVDVSIRYENYNDYGTDQFAMRLAYGFSLKKKK